MSYIEMEEISANSSPYLLNGSDYSDSLSQTSFELPSCVNCPLKADACSISQSSKQPCTSKFSKQARNHSFPPRPNTKPPSIRAHNRSAHMLPSKHAMHLRSRRPLTVIAGQSRSRKVHSLSPPHTTTPSPKSHFKPRLLSSISAPSLQHLKGEKGTRRFLLTRSASKKKRQRTPITGDPDDLEDWEWKDPLVRRLADAMFAIREERKVTIQRLEAIDSKIDALRRNLSGRDAA